MCESDNSLNGLSSPFWSDRRVSKFENRLIRVIPIWRTEIFFKDSKEKNWCFEIHGTMPNVYCWDKKKISGKNKSK